jgi:hypothetical protein
MELRDARREDPARFLRELRALRNRAGLGHAELAARAHYPCDVIKAAETGPSLPDLPVLSAFVQGCGGTPAEWEERWRAATGSPAKPLLTTRAAGCSDAADAGARVGASAVADGHDPDRVMAALNRVADGMAAAASSSTPTGANGSDSLAGTLAARSAAWDLDRAADEAAWDFDPSADEDAWDLARRAKQPDYRAPARKPEYRTPAKPTQAAASARPAAAAPAAATPAANVDAGAAATGGQVSAPRRLVGPGLALAALIIVTLAMVVLVLIATAHIFH